MRYSLRGLDSYSPADTDVALFRFWQIDPAIITDPVKMSALKLLVYCNPATMGANFVDLGQLSATMAYDETLNLIRVKSIDSTNQAAKSAGVGTANFCLVTFGSANYGDLGEASAPVVAGLPVGAGRPVELANGGVFTAVGQPLKLKTFALRLKGY